MLPRSIDPRIIDHTLLRPDATREEFERLCDEAMEHGFGTVCVPPNRVELCRDRLNGSDVKPITVVGFPLGYSDPQAKALEASLAVDRGAWEIDMVLQIGWLKDRRFDDVRMDIAGVVAASKGAAVKVILETAVLDEDLIQRACLLLMAAGASYVKTSTGLSKAGGATVEAVALMRRTVGDDFGVKASGGIRTAEDALGMVAAGATRIGASSSVHLVSPGGRAGSSDY